MTRPHAARMHPVERFRLIEDRGQTCQYCGARGDRWKVRGRYWHIDHIVPIQYGGSVFEDANLALACALCNSVKATDTLAALTARLTAIIAGELSSRARDHAPAMLAYRAHWPQERECAA